MGMDSVKKFCYLLWLGLAWEITGLCVVLCALVYGRIFCYYGCSSRCVAVFPVTTNYVYMKSDFEIIECSNLF